MALAPNQNSKDFKKDTVYIDVDDEITTIIDKLQTSPEKIVALVLPKRATVLQSVVNMKLLKRSAENAKKHLVLITSEAGLLPLAGSVGLHVASSLQSKPAIPPAPAGPAREQAIDEDSGEAIDDFDPDASAAQPVGALAGPNAAVGTAVGAGAALGAGAAGARASNFSEPETIELDNDEETPPAATVAAAAVATADAAAVKPPKKGKNKKLKVPNFNRFRLALFVCLALLILLIGGFIYANIALAHATITVKTNSSDIVTKSTLTLDPTATEVDLASDTLPAKVETKQQSGSQQVSTSGQKNNGQRASGTVTLSLTNCSNDSETIPAGTGVSSGGQTFITQSSATLESVSIKKGSVLTCANSSDPSSSTQDVNVIAQKAGAAYNIPAGSFTVAGFSDVSGSSSEPMTGGTDDIIKVVAQADIDSAKAKITSSDSSGSGAAKDSLTTKLQNDGYTPIPSSLNAGDPIITPSAAVGDQADTVTVTVSTAYTMYGVKLSDIKNIVVSNVNKQIDKSKQQILNDGVSSATYKVTTPVASGPVQVALSATSLAGPDIKPDTLKTQLAGKKTGDVTETIKVIPGVDDVSVKYSPFWVSSVPKKPAKIDIVIEKSDE